MPSALAPGHNRLATMSLTIAASLDTRISSAWNQRPLVQANTHGLQILPAHNVYLGDDLRIRIHHRGWVGGDESAVIFSAERQGVRSSRALDSGKGADGIEKPPEECSALFRRFVPFERRYVSRTQEYDRPGNRDRFA